MVLQIVVYFNGLFLLNHLGYFTQADFRCNEYIDIKNCLTGPIAYVVIMGFHCNKSSFVLCLILYVGQSHLI